MGRKTWESLPKKPLPKRFNFILSNTLNINNTTTKTLSSFQDALTFSRQKGFQDLWIIGGEQLYKCALESDVVDEIHVTYIKEEYDCDTFFPPISSLVFKMVSEQKISEKIEYHIYRKKDEKVASGDFL